MSIKDLDLQEDYAQVNSWWKARDMESVPKEYLTPFGALSPDKAAAWLYPTIGSNTAFIRYPITSPEIDAKTRSDALDEVFDALRLKAIKMGFTKLFITTNHANFSKRLERYGYIKTDVDCDHFWGDL